MEHARLHQQHHPGYGYPVEAAWMTARRMDDTTVPDVSLPVKFHPQQHALPQHQRTPTYQSAVGAPTAPRLAPSGPRSAMARRNERERKRVRLVNHGFATLRQYLPQGSNARKKLSKMETLRSAIEYIKQLQYLLDPTSSPSSSTAPSPPPPYLQDPSSDASWPPSGPPSWDDAWAQQPHTLHQPRSPSPHASLSPDTDLIDFGAFS